VEPLDAFLPEYEFSERHALEIDARPQAIDRAVRQVSLSDIPIAMLLLYARRLGRPRVDMRRPLLEQALQGSVLLEDRAGESIVMGLTGQFWRLRGGRDASRPRTVEEFLAYDRADACKAVIDFRIAELGPSRCRLSTETRVHVEDSAARRAFRRYWLVIRPFSGLIRILLLRAVRRQAREM
jgi:hypothetical protein